MAASGFFTSCARRAAIPFERARAVLALAAELLPALGELEGDPLVGGLHEVPELAQVERGEGQSAEGDDDVLGRRGPVVRRQGGGQHADEGVRERGEGGEDRHDRAKEHDALEPVREADRDAGGHRQEERHQRAHQTARVGHRERKEG